eukprot:9144103-Alexandrium_andersonii.AAC.1
MSPPGLLGALAELPPELSLELSQELSGHPAEPLWSSPEALCGAQRGALSRALSGALPGDF